MATKAALCPERGGGPVVWGHGGGRSHRDATKSKQHPTVPHLHTCCPPPCPAGPGPWTSTLEFPGTQFRQGRRTEVDPGAWGGAVRGKHSKGDSGAEESPPTMSSLLGLPVSLCPPGHLSSLSLRFEECISVWWPSHPWRFTRVAGLSLPRIFCTLSVSRQPQDPGWAANPRCGQELGASAREGTGTLREASRGTPEEPEATFPTPRPRPQPR